MVVMLLAGYSFSPKGGSLAVFGRKRLSTGLTDGGNGRIGWLKSTVFFYISVCFFYECTDFNTKFNDSQDFVKT